MKTLIYISELKYRDKVISSLLSEVTDVAKKRNSDLAVTGVLLFHNRHFLQVLEGDEKNVNTIFDKIKHDSRHQNIEIIYDKDISNRNYPNWSMELFNFSDPNKFTKPFIKKVKKVYSHNFEFNSNEFIFLLISLLEDPEFSLDY